MIYRIVLICLEIRWGWWLFKVIKDLESDKVILIEFIIVVLVIVFYKIFNWFCLLIIIYFYRIWDFKIFIDENYFFLFCNLI